MDHFKKSYQCLNLLGEENNNSIFFQKQDAIATDTKEIVLLCFRGLYHRSDGYIMPRREGQHTFEL